MITHELHTPRGPFWANMERVAPYVAVEVEVAIGNSSTYRGGG